MTLASKSGLVSKPLWAAAVVTEEEKALQLALAFGLPLKRELAMGPGTGSGECQIEELVRGLVK